MDLGLMSTANPSNATIDDILRDARMCADAGIMGIGNIAKAGVNMYNTVGNAFVNPTGMFNQPNPYQYQNTMGMGYAPPQAQYAYAETGMGYNSMSYINPMTSQMPMGYPGFADPDYGMGVGVGFNGFGGGF